MSPILQSLRCLDDLSIQEQAIFMMRRKGTDDVETVAMSLSRDIPGDHPITVKQHPGRRRSDSTSGGRGSLTVWLAQAQEVAAIWHPPAIGKCEGQQTHSVLTVETCLPLRLLYHSGLHQTVRSLTSNALLLRIDIRIPHYSTFNRCAEGPALLTSPVE
jgi:hypothetical protein